MVVKIDKIKYRLLLQAYNMDYYPRAVGFPSQRYLTNYEDLWKFFDSTRGENICFFSSNSYPEIIMHNNKPKPITIQVNNIFSDFDDAEKPENSMRDMRNLTSFLLKEEVPFLNGYSGSKGFADYLILEPQTFKYHTASESARALKRLVYGVHLFFQNGFKSKRDKTKKASFMKTMDRKVMKDPKRLCRMLYSPHCDMEGHLSGRYCYPLTIEQSLDWKMSEIVDYSYHPEFVIPKTIGKPMKLTDLVDHFDIDFDELEQSIEFSKVSDHTIDELKNVDLKLLLALIERSKPCIANGLMNINPDHEIRFAFAVFMKRLGKSMTVSMKFYEELGYHFGYVDMHHEEERWKQFDNIFDPSNNYVSEPSCSTMIRYGHCIAEECERFHKKWRGKDSIKLSKEVK